jgi:surface antigen
MALLESTSIFQADRVSTATIGFQQRAMRQASVISPLVCVLLTMTPGVAFSANAGFLNDTAITALTDADRKIQLDTALAALESTDPTSTKEWRNPTSGSSGRIETLGNFKSEDGLHCRKMKLFTRAKGIESQFAFPVCKNTNGEWFIASGKKLISD